MSLQLIRCCHWRTILKRLIHVVFFLSERGLPFRGDSCRIGDKHNGLFLGVLEVIASYDSTLKGHLDKALARNALKQLNDWNDCRGQGYDNGSNMSGIHNGVQAVMRRDNEAALHVLALRLSQFESLWQ